MRSTKSRTNGRVNGRKKSENGIRFGIVGAGAIAQTYAQVLEDCEGIRVVAVADIRTDAAAALAERLGCECYSSYETMTARTKLDAAIVCTTPSTHCEICLYLLDQGIHVLCEKPLALEVQSARRIVDFARKVDRTFTMASKFRYVEDVIRAKSIVMSGILGEIILFENAFTTRVDMAGRWNSDPDVSGGGVLIDNGSHSLDLVRYFLGPLAEVQVVEGKRVQELRVEDTVRIFVRSTSGIMGSIDLSWSIHKELDSYISIYGSHGTVFVGWNESKYRQSSSRDWVVFGKGYNKIEAFRRQILNFVRSFRGAETLLITAEDAVASMEAIEAAYEALHQNQWTSVKSASRQQSRTNGRSPSLPVAAAVA